MDSSAPKRRKTSPTTNIPVGASTIPPSDEPNKRPTRRQIQSFASPTKASLARSHPDILERRNASQVRSSNDTLPAPEINPGTGDRNDAAFQGESSIPPLGDNAAANNRNAQQEQTPSVDWPASPVRRVTGAMASRPRRTPNKPSPRPLPRPSGEEEELINPFRGRVLRRSPAPGSGAPEPEEPELPPTPTQVGLSDPASIQTSPVGIHNTPTRRPRRSRALAERIKSSPLKQPPVFPGGFTNLEFTKESTREESPSRTVQRALRAQPQKRKRRRKSHPARNIEELDPLAEKKGLRDSLLAEIASLKSDLTLAIQENDRLYQVQQSGRASSTLKVPGDKDGLLDLLRRHALPPEKETPPHPSQDWLEVALNPISFLPFSKTNPSLPSLFAPQQDHVEEKNEELPISHHPVSMTAEEELPYLQVFTPLAFTSTISIVPRDDLAHLGPPLQKHTISASSVPPGLFAAKIEMTVNTKTLAIAELSVPRLEPTAAGELGPFVEKVVQGTSTSALTRNVSVVTWAMSEWVRVATKRARFWCAVARELGTREGLAKCAKKMRKGPKRKGRPGRPPLVDEDGEDGDGLEAQAGNKGKLRFSKSDLLPNLGRTSFDLEMSDPDDPDEIPNVRIQWRIDFDWTGEAQSKMGLLVGAPAKCKSPCPMLVINKHATLSGKTNLTNISRARPRYQG